MSPRRPFQFHLSTLILVSFISGGLLWANLTPVCEVRDWRETDGELGLEYRDFHYGFPLRAATRHATRDAGGNSSAGELVALEFNPTGLVTDACVALAVLLAGAFVWECLVRREKFPFYPPPSA